jgi:hypothetical protein
LYSSQFSLHLPTMKICAVVLNGEFKIHSSKSFGLWPWVFGL